MMKWKVSRFAVLTAAFCFSALVVGAQNPPSNPQRRTEADIVRDNLEQRMNNMRNLDALARKQAEMDSREALKTRYFRPEMTEDLRERMEVDPESLTEYSDLLASPDAGALKLIAQKECGKTRNFKKATDCYQENANVREFANSYSFREKERTIFGKADIGVTADHFVAGRHSVQTLLVDLGERDLEGITADSALIGYLFSFLPLESAKGMDAQFEDLRRGLTVTNFENGTAGERFTYSKAAKISAGHVYALRTIAYRGEGSEPLPKDVDVAVVFRVIDLHDGAVTIIWKEISRGPGLVMKLSEDGAIDGK